MKKLNLESFGVQELDAKEMAEVQGGSWFWRNFVEIGMGVVAAVAAVALIIRGSENSES